MLHKTFSIRRSKATLFVLCIALSLLHPFISNAQQPAMLPDAVQKPPLTVDQVVAHIEQRNREQSAALQGFQATRTYRMQYRGAFGNLDAEMTVNLTYTAPNDKNFEVLSESGSKFIIEHIFKRLLLEEKEASNAENRQRTALSTRNYNFSLAGFEGSSDAPQYVLNVVPKSDNKYLYRGKIWVDAKDFAVTRIEAEPAKSPSFWIKKSEINHKYQKLNNFWLPAQNETESWIRFDGHALLLIEYKDYRFTDAPAQTVGRTDAKPPLYAHARPEPRLPQTSQPQVSHDGP